MSSFAAPVVPPTDTASMLVTLKELLVKFKTTGFAPAPVASPAIVPNATLEQDGETLLRLWSGWGKDQNNIRRGYCGDYVDLDDVLK